MFESDGTGCIGAELGGTLTLVTADGSDVIWYPNASDCGR
jgi:hypothetical protein